MARPEPGSRGRVLLVEDDVLNQIVAVGILGRLGYHADVAENGREAVAAVERGAYRAVLMDCRMPEMDGYQATAEIRRREGTARHVPVIAMTASATQADRDRCLAAGMEDFIAKPVLVDDLGAVLGDARAMGDVAHHLKGAAATLGSSRIVELCEDIESLAGADAVASAAGLLGPLGEELDRARTALAAAVPGAEAR